jgi:tRNA/rRNA methyltransferase
MSRISWILHQTSHPGNIGSAARAVKTMGFSELVLVDPLHPNVVTQDEALALASGADDVLKAAKIYHSLSTATQDYSLVFGLSARDREFGPPCISLKTATALAKQAMAQNQAIAFLFGTERTGLSNEDYAYCSHRVYIDANPAYSSLNLAQAVMVCAYEMRQSQMADTTIESNDSADRASIAAINGMMDHLKIGLEAIEFLDPKHPKKLMERLRALFDRAGLQTEEVDLLRGIAKQMITLGSKGFKL